MSNKTIVRAWKDARFRAEQGAELPENPAGIRDLAAAELSGGAAPLPTWIPPRSVMVHWPSTFIGPNQCWPTLTTTIVHP